MRVLWDEVLVVDSQTFHFEDRPFTGVAYALYPSGGLELETEFVDGIYHGETRAWFETGTLQSREPFWRGAAHGKGLQWTEDGRLRREEWSAFGIMLLALGWPEEGAEPVVWRLEKAHDHRRLLKLFRDRFPTAPAVTPNHGDPETY